MQTALGGEVFSLDETAVPNVTHMPLPLVWRVAAFLKITGMQNCD